jgi:hydrogenase maturation protease
MRGRVIGVGGRLAGDDAVGPAIVEQLRRMGGRVPPGVELLEAQDSAALVPWLETQAPVVIVDAVVGDGIMGEVVELDAASIGPTGDRPLSTHGLQVREAIALARVLHGPHGATRVWILGVRISAPTRGARGLSPAVDAAVPRAAEALLAYLVRHV